MTDKTKLIKFIAMGAAGLYAYQQFKENPNSLGSHQQITQKTNNLIDRITSKGKMPPIINGMAKSMVNEIINDRMNIRDVTPKKERV